MAENKRTITIDDLEWDVVPDIIPAIEAFISNHPPIEALLPEINHAISVYFQGFSSVTLNLSLNPETQTPEYLILTIMTDLDVDEAVQRLDKFDEIWWLDNLQRANGLIMVDVGFE